MRALGFAFIGCPVYKAQLQKEGPTENDFSMGPDLSPGSPAVWATPAAGITIADDTSTNATRYLVFTSATTGTVSTQNVSSTKLQFNPSTGAFTANQLIIAP